MVNFLRTHALRLSLGALALVVLAVGFAVLKNEPSEAFPGMPDAQRAYWTWISSIRQDSTAALKPGVELLYRHPDLYPLYLKLAEVCSAGVHRADCEAALTDVQPPNARAALYREGALALLRGATATEAGAATWMALADAPALDPALARRIVDADRHAGRLADVAAVWEQRVASDSTAIGALFGLGYIATRQADWTRAEQLLKRVTRLAPDDPEAYRELGRVYYETGQPDAFDAALRAGIEAAEARYDLEQQLILRGNLGWVLMERSGDFEKAEALFRENVARSRAFADLEAEAFNLYRLAIIRVNQGRHQEALALLDSAEARYATQRGVRPLSRLQVLRGTVLTELFRFSDAEEVLEKEIATAKAQRDVRAQVQAAITLAQLRSRMGRYAAAREIGLDALALAQENQTANFEIAARMVLGDVERRWGMFEKAQQHYQLGLAQAEATKNYARVRQLNERLGLTALNLQDANAAQDYYDRMLQSVQEHENPEQLPAAHFGLGQTYAQYGNGDEAIRYYDLALAGLKGGRDRRLMTNILTAKAWALIYDASYEEADSLLHVVREEATDDPSGLYRVEVALANVSLEKQDFKDALQHYERAEAIENELQRPSVHWHVLLGKALAYWHLDRPREAERAFREAVDVVETLRANLGSSERRSFFVKDKVQVYKSFAAFLEEQGRPAEAFSYTERGRSRGLVDLLYTSQQERKIDLSHPADQIIEMDRRLRALEEEISEEGAPLEEGAGLTSGTTRGASLLREYQRADSIYKRAEVDLAATQNRMYTFDPLPVDSVQALLAPGEAMVAYNLRSAEAGGLGQNASVAYVVLPDTVFVRQLTVDEQALTEMVHFFRDQISDSGTGPGTGWEKASERLHERLIAPVLAALPPSVEHLHLVPEGILNYVPFAALKDKEGHFLVERYTLSIAPSATILKLCRERNTRLWSYMLLLADPDGRLPGSRKEVLSIAAAAPNRRHTLLGEKATQGTFEEVAENYDVIHFATHGNFVARAPWRSHLELHEGELSVEEIGRLKLNAYLVTLSACETALSGGFVSDVPNGDEWVGLNQAFLAAGTPTVMASLWPIDDKVSSSFMVQFYELLGSEGKAHALAEVQRQFIRDTHTRHPFYWAAFAVIGDPL